MTKPKRTRAQAKVVKGMNASKTPSGGAAGWLPIDADESLAFKQLLINAHTGGDVPEFFADLVSRRRASSGKKGALSGAAELPDALLDPVILVIADPPANQQAIMRAIRNGLDSAILTASGPGLPVFRRWYDGNNRTDNVRLAAMLGRSIDGFSLWLESFPSE